MTSSALRTAAHPYNRLEAISKPFIDTDVENLNTTQLREFWMWACTDGPSWFDTHAHDVFSQLAELEIIKKNGPISKQL